MSDPLINLFIAAISTVFIFLIFWPERGLIAMFRSSGQAAKRVLMEDALKYIYNCEQEKQTCTVDVLAEALLKDTNQIQSVISGLENMELLVIDSPGFKLTPEGRKYALRIIRIHRLWERYLAEETGIPEKNWHEEAEKKEHTFTEEEINAINRQLGYPLYDPHGDPIPTPAGDLPPKKGGLITEFDIGDIVQVIQIEDKPPAVYAEIIEMGIHLGVEIEILKKTKIGIHVLVRGVVQTLSSGHTVHIKVVPTTEKQMLEEPPQALSVLKSGEKAEVIGISRACRGTQRRRLMDLGVVPGTVITMEMISAGGDPKAYNIRGATIALRDDQARFINIQPRRKTE